MCHNDLVDTLAASPSPAPKTGRNLARSTAWSLGGQTVPLFVALLTIPFLLDGLGTDRFGVLSLAWVVIGYFGLFDLGLGRAMTRAVAEKVGVGREDDVPAIFWTTMILMFGLGIVGMVAGLAFSPLLVNSVLNVPEDLRSETLIAFSILALSLPVDMSTSALRGAMEAKGRFDLTSLTRIATGLYTYAAPLAVMFVSHSLIAVVAALLAGRIVAWGVTLALCLRVMPSLRVRPAFDRAVLGPLLRVGGWMNVCGIVFPLMVTLDRFLIGSLVSVAAVAYYATPYEMVTKLWVLPTAIAGVLFPAFAAGYRPDLAGTERLFARGVRYVFLGIVPATLVIATLAHEGLAIWLGSEFADNSGRILQILAIGVCVNSLSNVPFALVQGAGRADLAAKLHLIELPVYVVAVWLSARAFGIQGVAIVWMVRGVVDTAALFVISRRLLEEGTLPVRPSVLVVTGGLLGIALALFPLSVAPKVVFLPLALGGFVWMGWMAVLPAADRALVTSYASAFRARLGRGRGHLAPRGQDAG